MYYIIRYAVFIILAVVVIFIMKKQGRLNKKTVIGSIIAAIVLCGVSDLVPVENLFVKFPTAESVYKYIYFYDVKYVVEGDKTARIAGVDRKEPNTENIYIALKDDDGYKLNAALPKMGMAVNQECSISLETDRKTKESYISVSSHQTKQLKLTDNHNSEFKVMHFDPIFGYNYFAYAGVIDDEYRITVNDNTYKIVNKAGPFLDLVPAEPEVQEISFANSELSQN